MKRISSSEDRLEETKRRKLSLKCQKLVELMMVSGIPTASGYEERIKFAELGVVESGPVGQGVLATLPEGHYTNGWDVNVAGVGIMSTKRNIRHHKHAVSKPKDRPKPITNLHAGVYPESPQEGRAPVLRGAQIW